MSDLNTIKSKIKNKDVQILDCTLRDGGYYNNWNFSESSIQTYITDISSTGIKYLELGFRFNETKEIKGLTAYTNKNLLNNLKIPDNLKIGVMINASDLIHNNSMKIENLKKLINKKNYNKINFVRIACHHDEIILLENCFKYLRNLNLKIFINIMQISELKFNLFKKVLLFLKRNKIEVIYLADSLGCLTPKDLNKIISFLRTNWNGEIGLHAHNNLNLALKNSLIGIESNFKWIDCTVTGMGRGPGNLKTEDILKYVDGYKISNKFLKSKRYFEKLKKHYNWGSNKFYEFAAKKKIHPTYVQKILSDKRYSKIEYDKILNTLSKLDTKKFNPYKLVNSTNFLSNRVEGKWSPEVILKDKDVLILGPGKSIKLNKKRIIKLILEKKLFVISLNTFSHLSEKFLNLRAICHPMRITSDKAKLNHLNTKAAIPVSSLPNKIKNFLKFRKENIYDYGLSIGSPSQLKVKKKYCILPSPLAIGYAISLAIAGKSKSIRFACFDGYQKSDPDNDNTEELLNLFQKKYFKTKFSSLTKTKLNQMVFKKSG